MTPHIAESQETEPSSSNDSSSNNQVKPPSKKRKRNSDGDEILKYMKESDREMTESTDKLIKNMEALQNTVQDMMGRLLDKL
ncbi:hypothetical protein SNE40_014469 [Patella caerulea]|uniref:Uncharacterized protein n=1 Tax=Patella caerulea TaxID=87958 RepID=A0AAN8PJ57_PATCE